MVERKCFVYVLLAMVFAMANGYAQNVAPTKALSPRAQLTQYMTDLKISPDDAELRKKIIELVQKIKPKPPIPAEAKHPFVKAKTFFKEAKIASDYDLAISAFKDALLLAPWWPEAYYNLGTAQESAEKFDDAAKSFHLYLQTKPKDAEAVEQRLDALEAKKELAAKRNGQARAEQAQKAAEESRKAALQSVEGDWLWNGEIRFRITQSNGIWQVLGNRNDTLSANASSRHISFSEHDWNFSLELSADGMQLTGRCISQQGDNHFDQECPVFIRRQ